MLSAGLCWPGQARGVWTGSAAFVSQHAVGLGLPASRTGCQLSGVLCSEDVWLGVGFCGAAHGFAFPLVSVDHHHPLPLINAVSQMRERECVCEDAMRAHPGNTVLGTPGLVGAGPLQRSERPRHTCTQALALLLEKRFWML